LQQQGPGENRGPSSGQSYNLGRSLDFETDLEFWENRRHTFGISLFVGDKIVGTFFPA
jgi:hypothetical protein